MFVWGLNAIEWYIMGIGMDQTLSTMVIVCNLMGISLEMGRWESSFFSKDSAWLSIVSGMCVFHQPMGWRFDGLQDMGWRFVSDLAVEALADVIRLQQAPLPKEYRDSLVPAAQALKEALEAEESVGDAFIGEEAEKTLSHLDETGLW